MKNFKRFSFVLLFIVFSGVLFGCGKDDRIKIGILQYASHNALDEARQGFIDGLKEAGYVDGENIKIQILNPEGDTPTMEIQSKTLLRKSDLIFAIATPAASSVVNMAKELNKNTPILFTAVTDPVESKLISSNENPGGNVTGTSDLNPIKEQIELVKKLLPNAKKLGILYTASERNSEIQADIAKLEAEKLGLTVNVKTIQLVTDIQQTASLLASDVDCLYIPTDNIIAGNMGIINDVVLNKKIPAIVGESNNVREGGSITIGINYYNLGKQTAEMAVKILRDNVSPKDIPSTGLLNYEIAINKKQLESIGITLPSDLLDNADILITE